MFSCLIYLFGAQAGIPGEDKWPKPGKKRKKSVGRGKIKIGIDSLIPLPFSAL